MNNLIKIQARPKLNSPSLLAAWPGIGNVSILVASYLDKKMSFKPLASINAAHFFDPIGVAVKDNLVESPQFPQSRFFYWKNPDGGNDIILFIGDDQPSSKGYELANCVVDMAEKYHAKRIYTCAAAITRIHHSEQPKVWGVATDDSMMNELKEYDLIRRGNLHISGLNGLLLGVAKERNIQGLCLLGEVPQHTIRIQNPMSALAILKVLSQMLGINIDTFEMAQQAAETKEKMKQLAAEAMGEYIDLFTEPIWEYGQENEEDYDDYEDEEEED